MVRKPKAQKADGAEGDLAEDSNLRVMSIVTIDDRGQMVLPKEVREKYGLKPGDKLAVVTRESGGRICCIHMFKPEELLDTVKEKVGTAPNERRSR